ncbi:MAG: hypothetical protein WDW38_011377 [Sanguina aurantia]
MAGHSHKKKGANKQQQHTANEETPLSKFPSRPAAANAPSSGASASRSSDPNTLLKPSQVSPAATAPQPPLHPRANGSSTTSTPAVSSTSTPATNDAGSTKAQSPRSGPMSSGAGGKPPAPAPASSARAVSTGPAPLKGSSPKAPTAKPVPATASKPAAGPAAAPAAETPFSPGRKGKGAAKQAAGAAAAAAAAAATTAAPLAPDNKPAHTAAAAVNEKEPLRSSVEICTPPDTGLASSPRVSPAQAPPAPPNTRAPAAPLSPAVAAAPLPAVTMPNTPASDGSASLLGTDDSTFANSQAGMASASPFPHLPGGMAEGTHLLVLPTSVCGSTPEPPEHSDARQGDLRSASFETFNISETGIGGPSNSGNAFDDADEALASLVGNNDTAPPAHTAQGQAPSPSADLCTQSAPELTTRPALDLPDTLGEAVFDIMNIGSGDFAIPVLILDPGSAQAAMLADAGLADAMLAAAVLADVVLADAVLADAVLADAVLADAVLADASLDVGAAGAVNAAAAEDADEGVATVGTAAAMAAVAGAQLEMQGMELQGVELQGVEGVEVEGGWLRSAVGALAPRHAALFTVLRALVRARSMGQHREALGHFSRTVMWDVPPILMRDREQMRVAVYLAKFAAAMDFRAVIVGVSTAAEGWELVEALLTFQLSPIMPWWLAPARLLLPQQIDIQATVKIGTRPSLSHSPDRVTWVWGRIHNFPPLPDLARVSNALLVGRLAVWTEPVWSRLLWLVGDPSYGRNSHGRSGGGGGGGGGANGAGKGSGHAPAGL